MCALSDAVTDCATDDVTDCARLAAKPSKALARERSTTAWMSACVSGAMEVEVEVEDEVVGWGWGKSWESWLWAQSSVSSR
jgi:hypothetical protein